MHRAAQCYVPGALGVADTSWSGASASYADAAAWDVSDRQRLQLLYVPCQSAPRCTCGRHGRRGHRSLLDRPGAAVVSCVPATLDTIQAAWASFAGTATSDSEMVLVTTVKCRATLERYDPKNWAFNLETAGRRCWSSFSGIEC